MDKNIYPTGWNDKRVRKVIDDIEARTEEETIAEDEAAFGQNTRGFRSLLDPSTGSGTAGSGTTGREKTAN